MLTRSVKARHDRILKYEQNAGKQEVVFEWLDNLDMASSIFGYLPYDCRVRLRTVCRPWKHAIEQSNLLKDAGLSGFGEGVGDAELRSVLRQSGGLIRLTLSGCLDIQPSTWALIAKSSPELKTLEIEACSFSARALQSFARRCTALRNLAIVNTDVKDDGLRSAPLRGLRQLKLPWTVSDETIQILACASPELKSLFVGGCYSLTAHGLGSALQQLPLLSTLHFGFCESMDGEDVTEVLASCSTTLTSLSIPGLAAPSSALEELHKCTSLTRLVAKGGYFSDEAAAGLVSVCPLLESVAFGCCKKVSDLTIAALARHCTKLKSLNLDHTEVTDKSLASLYSCTTLRRLGLRRCGGITGPEVIKLAQKLTRLHMLDVELCPAVSAADRDTVWALVKPNVTLLLP
mmetsp:Transcript_6808/g.15723  ORF Transcript_6808/g.15723 Transcript_6808/m.15723 type:complete len:404 (-) Transcript_6808:98-1309(-)